MERIMKIIKRDGRTVEFDVDKIAQAIFKAAQVLGGKDHEMSEYLAKQVELYLLEVCHNSYPTVEQVQDAVEKILIESQNCKRIYSVQSRAHQSEGYEYQTDAHL